MARLAVILGLSGIMIFAGCIDGDLPLAAPTTAIPSLLNELVLDHDHKDGALHNIGTDNFMRLSTLKWDALIAGRYPIQQYGEMDVYENYGYVAALVSGFAIVDLKDAANPKTLSYTTVPPGYVADIKAADKGNLVLLGMQNGLRTGLRALGAPLPGLPVPSPIPIPDGLRGIQAWDASNKAMPKPVGYVYVETGCHMLSVLEQETGTFVYCAPNDNTVRIFKLVRQGPAVVFQPVAIWSPEGLPGVVQYKVQPAGGQFTHDMTVQKDPLTGDPVMLVSFWNLGVYAVSVKDPSAPKVLANWAGKDATLYEGAIHTSMLTKVGDRRILVTIPEYAKTPAVFVLDATDYAEVRFLSEWQASPEEGYGEDPTIFSTHNFQIVGSRLYLAMYHGGIWALDLAAPETPLALGYVLPTGEPGLGHGFISGTVPDTWDVVVADGIVWAIDIPTGLHAFHLEGDPAGDARFDGFA